MTVNIVSQCANQSLSPGFTHARSDLKGLPGGFDACKTFASDIVGRAVCGRRDWDRESALDGDSPRKAKQLDRDLSLIVIHGDDRLILTCLRF